MTADRKSTAHSLGRFYRVVGTDGRISGSWVVMLPVHSDRKALVWPFDVVFWDEDRRSGRTASSRDLTAWVDSDGNVDLPEHMIRESIRYDVLDVRDELIPLLAEIVARAIGDESNE